MTDDLLPDWQQHDGSWREEIGMTRMEREAKRTLWAAIKCRWFSRHTWAGEHCVVCERRCW